MFTAIRQALRFAAALVGRFREDRGFVLASALSFSFVLCLAPLVLLLFSAGGFIIESDKLTDYVLNNAAYLLPGYGREVLQVLAVLTQERGVTGLLGAIGLAVFASQLFSLTRTVMNVAFRVRERRGLIHGFAFDLLAVAVLGLLAVVLSIAMLVVLTLGNLRLPFVPPAVGWTRLIALALMYLSLLALLFFIYRTFPYTRVPTRSAATATLAVALLWEAARWGVSAYLARFGTYGKLYGSFGAAVGTLVWIYYSAVIFVLGAELGGLLSARRGALAGAVDPADSAGG